MFGHDAMWHSCDTSYLLAKASIYVLLQHVQTTHILQIRGLDDDERTEETTIAMDGSTRKNLTIRLTLETDRGMDKDRGSIFWQCLRGGYWFTDTSMEETTNGREANE